MSKLISLPSWHNLKRLQQEMNSHTLVDLFRNDPERATRYGMKLDDLTFDFSRTHLNDEIWGQLVKLAEERHLSEKRAHMFRGNRVNNTEGRAALHTALRTKKDDPIEVDGEDVLPILRAAQKKMARFVADVREGRWLGATGKPIRTVVNIGIGGSDLGPRLVVSALRQFSDGPEVRFVANVDATDILGALKGLNPETTLFVIVSKTFTTQETLLNGRTAREWLVSALGKEAVAKHFVAVSANLEKVLAFGIEETNIFPMWDWIGGRYSLWSAVGLSIALAVGWERFKEMLAGASAMDEHFFWAPLHKNIPVTMALLGIWYRNFWDMRALAIIPYDERLRELPRFLQQLTMESNGKSISETGYPLSYPTAPVVFGECGSVAQHSFHQWLHQGTDVILTHFIGIVGDDWDKPQHHKVLLTNLKAQAEALRRGREEPEAPYKANPGNKPSCLVWLERLTPYNLGMLLALYEHMTFVQGVIWDINSFDQFGVELGKKLAAEMEI
jgi:glucose-6-phosphate isomerase